ncbi:SGNH/GDSL hydrolase family protein [Sphingomonas sp. DT-204]|uniref:SGNH/GDSL hydrolase family protein n=1 Tax=Sphingomonas sp. DT-204 TaxID=3396166 RepID=UPI003F1CD339
MMRLRPTWLAALAGMAMLCTGAAPAETPSPWLGSWAASQQVPEPHNALPDADLTDATLRQVVRLSAGGQSVRVLLSNAFGTAPLVIDAAHVALGTPGSARIGHGRPLTFDGAPRVTIPAGASYWSDPVAIEVPPLASLAVSVHLPAAPARQTSHPGSRATSYLVRGNHVGDPDLPGAKTVNHWYQLAAIDVRGTGRAIVTLGDSITDGHGVRDNRDERWPDRLAERLQADPKTRMVSVLNHGIGGNRLLLDGLGPNALARFDRDVLAMSGVRYLIVLEGVNDLGTLTRDAPVSAEAHADLVRRLIGAYRQIVARARTHGIKAIGATITPYGGSDYYHPDAANEADRQAINAWIRTPGNFDAVIDFDAVLRDPGNPARMRPAYDSGDHLHPGPAGYEAMADAIPLALFR